MLVYEHAYGDTAHVETVQEVLDVLVGDRIHAKRLFVLHHPLSHCGNHIVVPVSNVDQSLCESEEEENAIKCLRMWTAE